VAPPYNVPDCEWPLNLARPMLRKPATAPSKQRIKLKQERLQRVLRWEAIESRSRSMWRRRSSGGWGRRRSVGTGRSGLTYNYGTVVFLVSGAILLVLYLTGRLNF